MPLTADRPKCMVVVAQRPLIEHQLRWLAAEGVAEVVVSCGYKWECIRDYVGDGSAFGLRVTFAVEDIPLGRGGGLRKALSTVSGPEPVIACNGDVLTRLPLMPMMRKHKRSGAMATLLLVPYVSQHGIVELDDADRIRAFREKPVLPFWLSGGVYVLSPKLERRLPKLGDHETTTWPRLARQGRLQGHRYKGFWQSVDSAKDVGLAEALVGENLSR